MKKSLAYKKVFFSACLIAISLFLTGCISGGLSRSLGFDVDRGFANDCALGAYTALCWTITVRNQSIQVSTTFDNPLAELPGRGETGQLTGLNVAGTYKGKIKVRVSPALLLGTPPPVCALSPAVDGPSIATTVIDFKVTGGYKWVWGDGFTSNNVSHDNVLIKKSNLHIDQFDVHNLWNIADAELKKLFKNTVRRTIDKEVVRRMNKAVCFECTVPAGLPVYVDGYNPYSNGGFCN